MFQFNKPTLIIDRTKCRNNIQKMAQKAKNNQLVFRPHFKTHQSVEVGSWFKEFGVTKITVSSVEMAQHFADAGWNNITIAFPVNLLEIDQINALAARITLNLLVESVESATFLVEHLIYPTSIFIKIDSGYGRTGINPGNTKLIDKIIEIVSQSPLINFKGFLTHAGQSYQARGTQQILDVFNSSTRKIASVTSNYHSQFPEIITSYGDTPTCSVVETFTGIDEIRPGNFVYYDVMQMEISSCQADDIAVAVGCPVVAVHPERNELVIYGGAVHFSKESIETIAYGKIYGLVAENRENLWGNVIDCAYVKQLSQEHGIIKAPTRFIKSVKPGNILKILPVHSCLTANLLKHNTLIL